MAVIGTFDSLSEAAKLTQSVLLPGIVQEVYNNGALWPMMPVVQLDGYSMKYNREVLPGGGQFLGIGEEIASDADVTFTQVEVFLKRYIKQHDIDRFIAKTWTNINDLEAQAIQVITKGVTEGLEGELLYASSSADADSFDGLHTLVAANSGQVIEEGSGGAGSALNLINMYSLVDLVRPRPDYLVMNRNIQRRLSMIALSGTTSYPLMWGPTDITTQAGKRMLYWDGIPIIVSDYLTQTEAVTSTTYSGKTGGLTSSIFACRFGNLLEGGLCLLMGNPLMEPVKIENLEDKDASRYRLITYAAPALGSTKALAAITGISDVAVAA